MKTKMLLGASTAFCVLSGFAATESFSGTGSWMDPTAWNAGKLPDATNTVQVAGGAQLTFAADAATTQSVARLELGYQKDATSAALLNLQSGTLQSGSIFMGTATNAPSTVVQTGGTLRTTTKADPEFSIGYVGGSHNRYEISGGELVLAQTGHVGTYGHGELIQTGGKVIGGGWFIPGRRPGSTGLYEINAGSASFLTWGFIAGEYGTATVKVSGTGELAARRLAINGQSKVEIANGGKVSVDYVEKQNTTTGADGQILLDGGTLMARPSANNDPFITGVDHLYVGNNGATLDIPEGIRAAVRVPFAAAPGATAGDLVKKGDGVAYLFNEQTFKGKLRVEDGYLALVNLGGLPSFGADKLSVSPGASVIVDGRLEDSDFKQLLANVSASANAGLGVDSVGQNFTNAEDIVLNGNAEFSKTGEGVLSLTGENAWGGFTRIWDGTLDAKRGEGLPADSAIRFSGEGGVWAPREDVTLTVGTGAGEISADSNTPLFGFATVDGDEDLSVVIGSADTAFAVGTEPLAARTLRLDAAADTTLAFENPITVTSGNFTIDTLGAGKTVLNGEIAPQGGNTRLYKTGTGTLTLAGDVVQSAAPNSLYLEFNAGVVDVAASATKTYDILASSGATLWLTNNTAVTLAAGWFYAGHSGANATVNMSNGTLTTKSDCRFMVGHNAGSAGTFNLSGGEVSTGYLSVGGSKGRGTVNQSGGDVVANKESYIGQYTAPAKGEALSGESVYNLSNGTLTYKGNIQVGVRSNGRLEQSGGAVVETSGWTSLGRWEGTSGVINMTGGTYDAKAYGVIVGEIGNGTINISGDAVMTVNNLYIGGSAASVAYNANGTVTVTEGGTLKANAFIHGWSTNNPTLYVNGGTLGVCAETGAVYDWMRGLAGNFDVGPAGATLDTGAVDVYTEGLGLGGATTGTIVKKGSGALNLGSLPEATKVKVAEGTLGLRGSAKASQLVHRWSFNGTLEDSVGESDAAVYTPKGSVTASAGTQPVRSTAQPTYVGGKAVSLAGGKGTDMIGLGANILPKTGPVTVEIWTTLRSHQSWEKMFSLGAHQTECFLSTFNDCSSGGANGTSVAFTHGGANISNTTGTGYFKDGNPYYYVVRFTPVEGGTLLSAFTIDVLTGKRLGSYSQKVATDLSNLNQLGAWLGWAWWNDAVANATFDEVRVWNAALSESEMLAHVRKGPDEVFADTSMPSVAEDNVYPENPSAELLANNYLVHRWTFNNTLRDAIGGKLATVKAASQLPGQLSSVGGGKGASYIELGSNILPTTGPVTIEIWSTARTLSKWAKQFVVGKDSGNFIVTTFSTSKADGPSSFGVSANGFNPGNVQGAGTFPLNVPCCTIVTFTPLANGGTRAEMRIWNVATGEKVGGVGFFEGNFTLAHLTQNVARLNTATGFWGDVDENASYDEVRIWNAGLSESQQRINVQLGADRLPRLVPGALIGGEATELEVAQGAVVDLQGGEVTQYAVTGEGTVRNGTLVVDGCLMPGGEGSVGELTLEADARVTGVIRLDVGDHLDCAGALDLSAATIEVVNPKALTGAWTFATSAAEGVTGKPASNLKGTGYRLSISAGAAKVVPEGLALFFR